MSWREYALARRLLVEERIGTRVREAQHVEAAKAKRSKAVLQRSQR